MSIAALFIIASYGNNQDASLLMSGLRKCGIYIQWNFIQPQRRMKFCHLQVNASGNHNFK
jgi:sugar/nucleoside kinase (ribokinase family)